MVWKFAGQDNYASIHANVELDGKASDSSNVPVWDAVKTDSELVRDLYNDKRVSCIIFGFGGY